MERGKKNHMVRISIPELQWIEKVIISVLILLEMNFDRSRKRG